MGKRGANKQLTRAQGGPNLKSVLRHDHLKNLALWSTGKGTPIPSLATLFGRRLAAEEESSGIPLDPDLVSCQRCETILQPGFNCKVRIEKVSASKKKHMRFKNKKPNVFLPQNNVVYNCSFCSHRNLKRGTPKGQMKEMYPPKTKPVRPRTKIEKETMVPQEIHSNMLSSPERRSGIDQLESNNNSVVVENTPKPTMLTLEREKRIRKSKSKKPIEPESVSEKTTVGGGSNNKRKRKALTSINKETTNKSSSRAVDFKIPFVL